MDTNFRLTYDNGDVEPRVSAGDPLTLIGVAGLLTIVTLVASFIPRRAMRFNPVDALRVN